MWRVMTLASVLLVIGAAAALYAVKHDTRGIEIEVQARERAIEKAEADIAALKAERAYLGRPERIEHLARGQGLEPIREQQYARVEESTEDAIARLLANPDAVPDPAPDSDAP